MRLKRFKYVLIVVAVLLVGTGIWNISERLVSFGGKPDFMQDSKGSTDNSRKELETVRGTGLEQEGTYSEKAVQCVYDFFKENLPECNVFDSEYEVKDLEDGVYCVYIGDWYILVKGEYDLCYPYKFCKVSALSDYEMSFIKSNNIELSESGGVYSWEG